MNQFTHFKNLPLEIQSLIYEANLQSSYRTDKLSNRITKNAYVDKICTKSITFNEIKNYIAEYQPEHIYYFYQEKSEIIQHMKVMKYHLIDDENMLPRYGLSYEIVEEDEDETFYTLIIDALQDSNIEQKEPDLLTQYYIYYLRGCDTIKPYFSKNKVLKQLNNQYNLLYTENHNDLLSLYLYLRVNLYNFPILITKNIYLYYIWSTGEVNTLDNVVLNYDECLKDLYIHIDILYQQLIKQIKKLD